MSEEVSFADVVDGASDSEPLIIDETTAAPSGTPCEACGAPVETSDRFCPACGLPQTVSEEALPSAERAQNHFRCENCGSEVATDPDQRSYVCAFCDSTYVVEFSPDQTGRQDPEFVIGFSVTPDGAREKFREWIRANSWFRPSDLRLAQVAEKQRGVYLPFWSFSMLARSRWNASIGEYWYRTETYTTRDAKGNTVTKTRRVRETEWWPLSGRHHRYHSGYLVSGSRGLPQQDAERIKPFNLPGMKRYRPYFLAGWLCEEYSIERDAALSICREEFSRHQQQSISAFLPGDTHRNLQIATDFAHVNSDLCLLPVYILSYRYKDQLYRFLVNGQTGKVAGDKPLSWRRIGGAIAGGVVLLLIIILLFFLLSGA